MPYKMAYGASTMYNGTLVMTGSDIFTDEHDTSRDILIYHPQEDYFEVFSKKLAVSRNRAQAVMVDEEEVNCS